MLVDAKIPIPKQIIVTGKMSWDLCIFAKITEQDTVKITRYLLAVGTKL